MKSINTNYNVDGYINNTVRDFYKQNYYIISNSISSTEVEHWFSVFDSFLS